MNLDVDGVNTSLDIWLCPESGYFANQEAVDLINAKDKKKAELSPAFLRR